MNGVKEERQRERAMKINMQRMSRRTVSKEVEVKQSERKEKFQETMESRKLSILFKGQTR